MSNEQVAVTTVIAGGGVVAGLVGWLAKTLIGDLKSNIKELQSSVKTDLAQLRDEVKEDLLRSRAEHMAEIREMRAAMAQHHQASCPMAPYHFPIRQSPSSIEPQ